LEYRPAGVVLSALYSIRYNPTPRNTSTLDIYPVKHASKMHFAAHGISAFLNRFIRRDDAQEPLLEGFYPMSVVLPVFSALVIILDTPPLVWHFQNRNVAAFSLVLWLIILNFFNFLNPLIWPNDNVENFWDGRGLCDIEVRLNIGSYVGMPGAILCIVQSLASVMDTKNTVIAPSKAMRRRKNVADAMLCFGLPVFYMLAYYFVQPFRYYINGITGCGPAVDASWVAFGLLLIWPVIFAVIDAYYAGKSFLTHIGWTS
jgi:hypothetical protein